MYYTQLIMCPDITAGEVGQHSSVINSQIMTHTHAIN